MVRVKSVNFNFSAKASSTDYNESNKPIPKSLSHIGSEKSLVELGVPENGLTRNLKSQIRYMKRFEKL